MRTQQTFTEDYENLYNSYNESENGRKLLRLEGISREFLDIGEMSKAYFTEKVPDITSDANSNCNEGICQNNYSSEIVKGLSKLDGYFLIFHYAKKRFGVNRAIELVKSIWRGDVYYHDSTKPMIPYCFAFSTSVMMNEGRQYGQLYSLPPKYAKSFISQVTEASMDLSQTLAGAIAPSDMIINLAWYTKREGTDDKEILQMLQSFVHVMNNKFRVSAECVDSETEVLTPNGFKNYLNLSVNDDIYVWNNGNLEIQKVNKVNISHYNGEMHIYEGHDITQMVTPNHRVLHIKNNPHMYNYVGVHELVESNKLIGMKTSLNIPIATLTYNIEDFNISDAEIQLSAHDLRKSILPNWIFRLSRRQANLFIDTLFDGHTVEDEYGRQKLQVDNYEIADQLQHLCVIAGRGSKITERVIGINGKPTIYVMSYTRNSTYCKNSSKVHYDGIVWCPSTDAGIVIYRKNGHVFISGNSPFSNVSLFDRVTLENVTKNMVYPDFTKPDIEYIMHIQKIFGEWFAKGDPSKDGLPYRFPIITVNLSKDSDGNILDQDFLEWVSKNNLNSGCFNIYVNDGVKIASCCRMINSANKMRKYRGDSFGNGGMSIGSHRVVTINLPRIAIKSGGNIEKFNRILNRNLEVCRDLLVVHREEILKRRVEQGFIHFMKPLGWFTLDHMFSTIGIIGTYECCCLMGKNIRQDDGFEFTKNMLESIEAFADKTSEETGNPFNVEEIPGESVAVKLCQKDKILFGEDKVPFNLYSNQYIPLVENVSIPERINVTGKFMDILSGGGILHLNIMEKITDPSVMKHLIEQCVKSNVSHFAVNYSFGICEDDHISVCGNSNMCPICGKSIKKHMTRVVGYFSIVDNWSKVRREYEFPNRVFS